MLLLGRNNMLLVLIIGIADVLDPGIAGVVGEVQRRRIIVPPFSGPGRWWGILLPNVSCHDLKPAGVGAGRE
jgi:hypothetical protein